MAGGEGTMQLKIQGIAVSIALLLLFLTFAKRGLKKYAKIILMVKILKGIHTIFI